MVPDTPRADEIKHRHTNKKRKRLSQTHKSLGFIKDYRKLETMRQKSSKIPYSNPYLYEYIR